MHIIAVTKEQGEIILFVGCQLSRVRTGMTNHELTCAVPGAAVGGPLKRRDATAEADRAVAAYAAEDARRFPPL